MTKLDDAADKFGDEHTCHESAAFAAGARWALEQMTSEAAVKAAVQAHEDGMIPLSWVLDAVRKDIES